MVLYETQNDLPLTEEEIKARDIMVNLFIPVLKFILSDINYDEFKRWGFNSCRQTAILGAVYLKSLLPSYTIKGYEGVFEEDNEEYEHGFIIASKDSRKLIIDLSRTHKRLLFRVIKDDENLYPHEEEYSICKYKSKQEYNLTDLFYKTNSAEYITGKNPRELFLYITSLVNFLKNNKTKEEQNKFANMIYTNFTCLKYN